MQGMDAQESQLPILAYDEIGAGAPVVLLHGLAGTAHLHFAPLMAELAPDFRVIAPDLRGWGRSRGTARRYDDTPFAADVQDILQLLRFLGVDRPHLVGYSDGGEIALQVAAQLPTTRSVTAWGVSGRVPPADVVAVFADPERGLPDWPRYRAELLSLHGEGALESMRSWASAMRAIHEQRAGVLLSREAADQIVCPVLLLAGDHDPFNPLAATQALAQQLPTARLLVLPGAGHDLLSERAPQVIAVLRRMLSSH